MINVNTCNVTSGKGGRRSAPHGPMTSYTTITTDNLVIELEQKCKKFAIYKLLEGSLSSLMCTFFFIFLESMRKDMGRMARDQDKFWKLTNGEQRFYTSCLLAYSILCLLSGLTSLTGIIKANTNYMKICFCIQVTSLLLSTLLLIPTLYFVGPVFKGLLSFFALVYFPYNIYLTYIIKHYLDTLSEDTIHQLSPLPGKLYECPNI